MTATRKEEATHEMPQLDSRAPESDRIHCGSIQMCSQYYENGRFHDCVTTDIDTPVTLTRDYVSELLRIAGYLDFRIDERGEALIAFSTLPGEENLLLCHVSNDAPFVLMGIVHGKESNEHFAVMALGFEGEAVVAGYWNPTSTHSSPLRELTPFVKPVLILSNPFAREDLKRAKNEVWQSPPMLDTPRSAGIQPQQLKEALSDEDAEKDIKKKRDRERNEDANEVEQLRPRKRARRSKDMITDGAMAGDKPMKERLRPLKAVKRSLDDVEVIPPRRRKKALPQRKISHDAKRPPSHGAKESQHPPIAESPQPSTLPRGPLGLDSVIQAAVQETLAKILSLPISPAPTDPKPSRTVPAPQKTSADTSRSKEQGEQGSTTIPSLTSTLPIHIHIDRSPPPSSSSSSYSSPTPARFCPKCGVALVPGVRHFCHTHAHSHHHHHHHGQHRH